MKTLAIDTSCDETAVAVTEENRILANIIWSQASLHAKWGGVLPSLAQREHEKRIDWVVAQALKKAGCNQQDIGAIAVTYGPGLAIALGVGINKAKELARTWKIPLVPINHIEGHLLSSLAISRSSSSPLLTIGQSVTFPALGLVVSGGHTELVFIKKIGEYQIIAETQDDALGEALDKAARMLGLGYPGGAFLEKLAREGDSSEGTGFRLPLPMQGRESRGVFSYSGLKTAMWRLIESVSGDPATGLGLSAKQTRDLAAVFQEMAFKHLTRVMKKTIESGYTAHDLLVGGGVAANTELRKRLRELGKELGMKMRFPYSKKLIGDNAAMIGVAAGYKLQDTNYKIQNNETIDREARARVDKPFKWEQRPRVVLGLVHYGDMFLLIKRRVLDKKLSWAFPGGSVEKNESNEEAVVREVKAETGLNVKANKKLLERSHPDTGLSLVYFDCTVTDGKIEVSLGEPEDIAEVRWIKAEQVLKKFTSDVHPKITEFVLSKSKE